MDQHQEAREEDHPVQRGDAGAARVLQEVRFRGDGEQVRGGEEEAGRVPDVPGETADEEEHDQPSPSAFGESRAAVKAGSGPSILQ